MPSLNTVTRAKILASAAREFPLLGEITADDLLETIHLELGHAEILDGFRPYASHFSKATPLSPILHILSGNTPHAGLQTLLRGLLIGAQNLLKLPSSGLPEVERFVDLLPEEMRPTVSPTLPDTWLHQAQAIITYGSDETIAHFRRKAGATVFEAHPHRVSLGIVFEDLHNEAASLAARDASRFNQKGCLSPHDFYVAGNAREFAKKLAAEMAAYEATDPRGSITPLESAEISDLRANYRFRAASDPRVQIWESDNSTAWTVIFEEDPWFASSCLNRVVFVKPLPAGDLTESLGPAQSWMGAVGIWPATPAHAETAAALLPSRICPLGRMQDPPITWHQEGRQTLAPLIRWVDFEPNLR